MAGDARDRLGRMLRAAEMPASSVELKARPDDLALAVEGLGPVKFPVTAASARKLVGLGQPARFGRGEETVTDPLVRDTWEIPKELVRATWNAPMLGVILATVKDELGLPPGAELTADLHSLLVYGPNQFFLAHQDSEKDDAMVGTLVVTLPSVYTGGDLLIGHNEEWKAYRGSKTELSLVAFYADCQHEVLRVKSGYRITLTYNLLLTGDTSRPEGEDGRGAEAAALLREHFATPAPRYSYGEPVDPPNRLVFFLDHEYTPRTLGWPRLKGADAARAAVLRAAAERAGCEATLALADIKTTHSAFAGDGYQDHWDEDEDADEEDDDYDFTRTPISDPDKFSVQELIDSEISLTHWTGPDGRHLVETSLWVQDAEVCAATENGDLTPYSTEYEGYMGNWGNTLDRWYHRAAIVVWPRSQAFANRAETSPSWALDQLTTIAADDRDSALACAGTLQPFWEKSVRGLTSQETGPEGTLLSMALRAAVALGDAAAAQMLLRPFRVELLAEEHTEALALAAGDYGRQWTASLLRGWFGDGQPAWSFSEPRRNQWIASRLPALTRALDAAGDGTGDGGAAAAGLLLDLSWTWLGERIHGSVIVPSPRLRDQLTGALGEPLSAVLASAASLGATPVLGTVRAHVTQQPDPVTVLELATLRAAASTWAAPASGTADGTGLASLAGLAAAVLHPPEVPGRT